jgi:HK97 family phage portal protein
MGVRQWFAGLVTRAAKVGGVPIGSDASLSIWGNTGPTSSGYTITEDNALRLRVIWRCRTLIAQDIAKLPIEIIDVSGGNVKEVADHPLYWLLNYEPNPEMSAQVFKEALVGDYLNGLGIARIVRNAAGQPVQLWPIPRTRWTRLRDPKTQQIVYNLNWNGMTETVPQSEVFELPGQTRNGVDFLSTVQYLAESLGLNAALTESTASSVGSMLNPAGVMKWATKPDPQTRAKAEEIIERDFVGAKKRRVLSLMPGQELAPYAGMNHQDAQLVDLFKFSETMIANAFGVPPHMVGVYDNAHYANIEHGQIQYWQGAISPIQSKFEIEGSRKLLAKTERNLRIQINEHELLRGDWKTQMEAIASGRQWGVYTANQACRKLGEPVHGPQGDVLQVPINMQNAEALVGQDRPAWEKEQTSAAAPVGGSQSARSLLPIVADACVRLGKIEADRLAKAKTEQDRAAFWDKHAEHVREAMFPSAEALSAMFPGPVVGKLARAMTDAYVKSAKESETDAESRAVASLDAAEALVAAFSHKEAV